MSMSTILNLSLGHPLTQALKNCIHSMQKKNIYKNKILPDFFTCTVNFKSYLCFICIHVAPYHWLCWFGREAAEKEEEEQGGLFPSETPTDTNISPRVIKDDESMDDDRISKLDLCIDLSWLDDEYDQESKYSYRLGQTVLKIGTV